MKNYKLKLTALTPLHIGTGEVYEPTNFVIDNGYLYEFDEILFYKSLPTSVQRQFQQITQTGKAEELFEKIHKLIIENKELAKKSAYNKIKVSSALEKHYTKDIAKPVQIEGRGGNQNKVFNKFEIEKTQRLANGVSTYLTGSSIKGAISTAYQAYVFKQHNQHELKKLFEEQKLFRNLSISDTLAQHTHEMIGYVINKERFEEDDAEISRIIEVNLEESSYLIDLTIKDLQYSDNGKNKPIGHQLTKERIIQSCNDHYLPLFRSMFEGEESQNLGIQSTFIDQYTKFQPQNNQFLIRVGKHSGARAVTIEGLRKILVKLCQIQNKKDEGNDTDKRIERLHKKSYFENSMTQTLLTNIDLLSDRGRFSEKDIFNQSKKFLENPSELEDLIQNIRRVTINTFLTEEMTVWLYGESKESQNLLSLGWLLCEFIEDDEYQQLYQTYKTDEQHLIEERLHRQKEIVEFLAEQKRAKEEAQLAKQKRLEEEERKEAEAEIREQQRLNALSPLERKIEELHKQETNMPKSTFLLKAIQNNQFGEQQSEALEILIKLIKEEKRWKEQSTSKNPKKDKNYQLTLQVIKLQQDYKE